MSEKYPTLETMGVTSLQEIERYSVQTTNNVDVLRVVYKREKGSFLPNSKKYRFGRYERPMVTDSGSSTVQNIREISPVLSKAIEELESIVSKTQSRAEQLAVILDEITRLEEEHNTRIQYLRSLVNNLD